MLNLFDTHCHFDFLDPPLPALWQRCRDVGLSGLLVPGVSPAQWPHVIAAAGLPGLHAALGLHPCYLQQDDTPSSTDDLIAKLEYALQQLPIQQPSCSLVAIGECGLDGMIETPMLKQIAFFEAQLALAREQDLPVVIHARRCHNDMLRSLKRCNVPRGGIIHAFSGSVEIARGYVGLGYLLGVGGTITYERANKTRNAIAQMPLSALVLETDAPDMPIAGRQGEPNSPLYLSEIAAVLAQLQSVSIDDVALQTTLNANRLFGLDHAVGAATHA